MQRAHAKALEEVARRNDALRADNARLGATQATLEVELQRAEHETRMAGIEGEEVRKSMASAVRELVPLRQEVVEQRQQLKEVSRATAALKAAKDEDQASFMIAKKATARILRNKHLKTLDTAVKEHRASLRRVEEEHRQEQERAATALEASRDDAEARHKRDLERMRAEEERSRREMQERLRKELEGEEMARAATAQSDYERALEQERLAASARLVQSHQRVKAEWQTESEKKREEHEKSAASRLQRYADDAAEKLAAMNAKADRAEAELEWTKRELAGVCATFEGTADKLHRMIRERDEGWAETVAELKKTQVVRDEWKETAMEYKVELMRQATESSIATQAVEVERENIEGVLCAVLRAECEAADAAVDEAHQWRLRSEELGEELQALRGAHRALLSESQQMEHFLRKDMRERKARYEDEIADLRRELDALQARLSSVSASSDSQRSQNRQQAMQIETLRGELRDARIEALDAKRTSECLRGVLVAECTMEDELRESAEFRAAATRTFLQKEAETPLLVLKGEVRENEAANEDILAEVIALKRSVAEELEWQRAETRKAQNLLLAAEHDAAEARAEMERVTRETAEAIRSARAEVEDIKETAARECAKMLAMKTLAEEEHAVTRSLLDDERRARGYECVEMERLRAKAEAAAAAARSEAEQRAAAEERLSASNAEFATSERQHANHLYHAMAAMEARLADELSSLGTLDEWARIFQESDDARIATWQAKVDYWEQKHTALQEDRDELQARFDWLLVRFAGREPRQQDVEMVSALQEELSRQMHLTAHAVNAAKEYKEALRTNDAAYTHLFGLGALLPSDYVKTHNEIEARLRGGGDGGRRRGRHQRRQRPRPGRQRRRRCRRRPGRCGTIRKPRGAPLLHHTHTHQPAPECEQRTLLDHPRAFDRPAAKAATAPRAAAAAAAGLWAAALSARSRARVATGRASDSAAHARWPWRGHTRSRFAESDWCRCAIRISERCGRRDGRWHRHSLGPRAASVRRRRAAAVGRGASTGRDAAGATERAQAGTDPPPLRCGWPLRRRKGHRARADDEPPLCAPRWARWRPPRRRWAGG